MSEASRIPPFLRLLQAEALLCTLAVMSFVALVGPLSRDLGLAPWQAGTAVTVGGLAWVALARAWGAASDRLGRRRVVLMGLGGFVLSYGALCLFMATALHLRLPAWLAFAGLVLLRGAAGGFYAAVPVCAAALVADHLEARQRAAAMAALGAASGVGMVAGPGLVGLLAGGGLLLPLAVTAALPAVALALLWRGLPREAARAPARSAPPHLFDPRLRGPQAMAFVAMFSVTVAQIVVGFFALDRLGLDAAGAARAAGLALTSVGVALIAAQLLVRRLAWPPARLIRVGGLLSAAGFALSMAAHDSLWLCIGYFVAAAGMGWVFPAVSALAANAVQPHEQGAAAGSVSAAHGLGMIVGPLAGTLVYPLDSAAPFGLVAVLLAVAALWVSARVPGGGHDRG